jgi:hypothetical protein
MEAMASLVIALLFLRYWRLTRERLYGWFALAFAVLGGDWIVHISMDPRYEVQSYSVYLGRLAAFLILIVAIFDKNRRRSRR